MGLDYKNVDSAINKIDEINLNLDKTITDEEIEKAKKIYYRLITYGNTVKRQCCMGYGIL